MTARSWGKRPCNIPNLGTQNARMHLPSWKILTETATHYPTTVCTPPRAALPHRASRRRIPYCPTLSPGVCTSCSKPKAQDSCTRRRGASALLGKHARRNNVRASGAARSHPVTDSMMKRVLPGGLSAKQNALQPKTPTPQGVTSEGNATAVAVALTLPSPLPVALAAYATARTGATSTGNPRTRLMALRSY